MSRRRPFGRLQRMSLRARLLQSYLLVLGTAFLTVIVVVRLVAPPAVRAYFDSVDNHAPNAVVEGVSQALSRAILITVFVAAIAAALVASRVAKIMPTPSTRSAGQRTTVPAETTTSP